MKTWQDITSDRWALETIKGAKIDVYNIRKVPLNELRLSETFSVNKILLTEKEIEHLLKKYLKTEMKLS